MKSRFHYMTMPLLTLAFLVAFPTLGYSQDFWNNLGGRIRQEARKSVSPYIPPIANPPWSRSPSTNPPGTGNGTMNSIPSEGGNQNNDSRFGNRSGFLLPGFSGGGQPQYTTQQPYVKQPYVQQPYVQRGYTTNPTIVKTESPSVNSEFRGEPIKIICPKSLGREVSYKLIAGTKEYAYTMRPGETQTFAEKRLWLVKFYNGRSEVTFRLRGGNQYLFNLGSDQIVGLYRQPAETEFAEPPLLQSK